MTEKEDEPPAEDETYLGRIVKKIPPAYAEGVDQGPTAKPRSKTRSKRQ